MAGPAMCLCSACAIANATFEPDYDPVIAGCDAGGKSVVLTPPADERTEKHRVGVKKNGYGHESASLFFDVGERGVPGWVSDALAAELTASGIEVEKDRVTPAPGSPAVTVVVRQFYVEPQLGGFGGDIWGQVVIRLEVAFADGTRYERVFKGEERTAWFWGTDGEYEGALLDAARAGIAQAASGLCDLLAGTAEVR